MIYTPPLGSTDPNAVYIDGDESTGTEGSIVPAAAIEHPMREIQNAIIEGGLTPNKGNQTQLATIIKKLSTQSRRIGDPFWHLGETPPVGAMQFAGQILDRVEYSDLFNSLQNANRNIKFATEAEKITGSLNGCWGLGDGSTTFSVPEMRGEFIRSWGGDREVDSGRLLGQYAADEFKSHIHSGSRVPISAVTGTNTRGIVLDNTSVAPSVQDITNATGGSETRPRSVAWMLCFYYE
jgi:hypothetical protein